MFSIFVFIVFVKKDFCTALVFQINASHAYILNVPFCIINNIISLQVSSIVGTRQLIRSVYIYILTWFASYLYNIHTQWHFNGQITM